VRFLLDEPSTVHWSVDDWKSVKDTQTRPSDFKLNLVEIPAQQLPHGATLRFTLRNSHTGVWEGRDYTITIG
jgi:hypothetical protein